MDQKSISVGEDDDGGVVVAVVEDGGRPRRPRRGLTAFLRPLTALLTTLVTALATVLAVSAGPVAASEGSYAVRTDSGLPLTVRKGPGTDWEKVGSLRNGTRVRIGCTFFRDGRLWDKLASGGYVADEYVMTGTNGAVAHRCTLPTDGKPPQSGGSGSGSGAGAGSGDDRADRSGPYAVRTDSGLPLTVRKGPGTDWEKVGSLRNGTQVRIGCTFFRDGRLWDKLASGGYVADEYVMTGTNGAVAHRCTLPADGKPPRSGNGGGKQDDTDLPGGIIFTPPPEVTPPPCSLGGSEAEVFALLFEAACVDNQEVFGPDPGDPAYPDALKPPPGETTWPGDLIEYRRPFLIQNIGPNGENSYGIRWDGCSVPDQAALIPGMGDPSHPFGFDFLPACQVHDLGYRLIDRHILPESAEVPMDNAFARMLGRICLNYPDRIGACRQVAGAYVTAVTLADHQPKPDDYPRIYAGR